MYRKLVPVIKVDEEKCRNCHACITVCPVKYCIDGSGDYVKINHDLCIGCVNCIEACTHNARSINDDTEDFLASLSRGEKIAAVVAPSVAAVFPDTFLNFNSYIKSLGINTVFDVSFGAELTVKSYLSYIDNNNPELVISQPCPAIVTYIELYQKELIKYLAPADSPMLHTIKMIREYYPEYKDHKIAVFSPCPAKKREFEETGMGDFNVTFDIFKKYLTDNNVDLKKYSESDYDNFSAERAVLFSTPGGLLRTVERVKPEVINKSRKIEGSDIIYKYLKKLPDVISKKMNPLLIDCLNCELGCNGGGGTGNSGKSPDEIEYMIEQRSKKLQEKYKGITKNSNSRNVDRVISKYYKEGLYKRSYQDLSGNMNIKIPSEEEVQEIYRKMHKTSEEDIINCSSCGYQSCLGMATAIFNRLNKPENCHYYKNSIISKEAEDLNELYLSLHGEITGATEMINEMTDSLSSLAENITSQSGLLLESSAGIEELISSIRSVAGITAKRKENISLLRENAFSGENDLQVTLESMEEMIKSLGGINDMVDIINSISTNTNLLSMNAAIEAAHAGSFGKGFAVVADEIGRLSEAVSENADMIGKTLNHLEKSITGTRDISVKSGESQKIIISGVKNMADSLSEMIIQMDEMSAGSSQLMQSIEQLNTISHDVKKESGLISDNIDNVKSAVNRIEELSAKTKNNFKQLSESL